MAKQVVFKDKFEGGVHAGIALDDGSVICGCCGGLIELEDYTLIKEYEDWVNLEHEIIGDDDEIKAKE